MFLEDRHGRLHSRYTMAVAVHVYTEYPGDACTLYIIPETYNQAVHVYPRRWSEVLLIQSTKTSKGMKLMTQHYILGDLYQRGMHSILW